MSLIGFNPTFYLNNNPDVAQAVADGTFSSAAQHYEQFGKRELSRDPNALFDSSAYASNNPDVLEAVSNGALPSVYDHFVQFGINEDRPATPTFDSDFYLDNNKDVEQNYDLNGDGTVSAAEAFDHFVNFGSAEGRAPSKDDGDGDGVNGDTFSLTDSIDNLTGTNQNDKFIGDDQAGVGGSVIDAGDIIDGGDGNGDRADFIYGAGGTSTLTLGNVERVFQQSLGGTQTFNAVNSTGVEQWWSNKSTNDLVVSNVQELGVVGVKGIEDADHNYTVQFSDTVVSGATDGVNVVLDNAELTNLGIGGGTASTFFSTVNVSTTGSSEVDALADGQGTALSAAASPDLQTLNVDGKGSLSIAGELTGVTTVDASKNEGGTSVVIDDAKDVSFTGGKGDDSVDTSAGTTANGIDGNDTLKGGEGTDNLTVADGGAAFTSTLFANVSGFETLTLDNSTAQTGTDAFDIDEIIDNNDLTGINVDGSAATEVNNINDGALDGLSIGGVGGNNVTFTAKNFVSGGTSDAATIETDDANVGTLKFSNLVVRI